MHPQAVLVLEELEEDQCVWSAWGVGVLRDDIGGVTCRSWKGFGFSFTCSGKPLESFDQGSYTTWFSV